MNNGDKVVTVRPVTFGELFGMSFGTPEWRATDAIPKGAVGKFVKENGLGGTSYFTVEWDGERGTSYQADKMLAVPESALTLVTMLSSDTIPLT